jgi:hypothetical protein
MPINAEDYSDLTGKRPFLSNSCHLATSTEREAGWAKGRKLGNSFSVLA